ncbi:MAG: hypothetical protein HQL77_06300 [Magnetococcales bacterium]|nr:hypothetical protein [Magnetococcales bacterium]
MGNTIAFDTHAYVKKLREAGVNERQAEVQAEALVELVEDRLATKRDFADLKKDIEKIRADLQRDIKELDAKTEIRLKELDTKAETRFKETDAKLKELELRMVIKMGGMILAGIGILFGLMRAWPLPVQFVPVSGQEMRPMVPMTPPGGASVGK